MTEAINISPNDVFQHLKLSCKIPKIISEIADCQIIQLAAKELNLKVEPDELQKTADSFRIDNQLQNTKETWSWLEKHYLSLDDFEALVETNALAQKLAQHLFTDQVDSWFYEHQVDYVSAVLYEIVFEEEDLAMEIFCSLQEREISFHEVARQYIQDESLRRAGGYLGLVNRKNLKPEISAAVFDALPPQILKPIKINNGNHLILVEEIIQPELDQELRVKIVSDLFNLWLKEKRKQLQININFGEQTIKSTLQESIYSNSHSGEVQN